MSYTFHRSQSNLYFQSYISCKNFIWNTFTKSIIITIWYHNSTLNLQKKKLSTVNYKSNKQDKSHINQCMDIHINEPWNYLTVMK